MELASSLFLLVCYVGGPGTTQQAQPVLEKFLRQVETSTGWKGGTLRGVFQSDAAGCARALGEHKPRLLVADLGTYLSRAKALKLKPLAHMGPATSKRYSVVVKQGRYQTLAALKGKTLVSTVGGDPRFIGNVILDGKVTAEHFKIKTTRLPLKALRNVASGAEDAALIDEQAARQLPQLGLPLTVLQTSAALPNLTLALVGAADEKLVRQVHGALPKLCTGAGTELCRTFGVAAFHKAQPALFARLLAKLR